MLSGVFPPLPTPFREEGALDLGALAAHVSRLNETPLAGYLALGSNGEAVHLSPDEATAVLERVERSAAPGKTLLAGTGQLSTAATVEMCKRAAGAGFDAALVLTPYYYKGAMTAEALQRHFEAVADASPIPVLLYNVPANTGLNLAPAVAAEVAKHPNVVGVKDSAGDVSQLAELVRLTRGEKPFSVLSGSFGAFLPGLTFGVAGAVVAVANLFPEECVAVHRLFAEGRIAEAGALHLRLLPIARAVTSQHGVAGLKAALAYLGRPCGGPRSPLRPLDGRQADEVRAALETAGRRTSPD